MCQQGVTDRLTQPQLKDVIKLACQNLHRRKIKQEKVKWGGGNEGWCLEHTPPPLKKKKWQEENGEQVEQVDEALKKGGGRWWEDRSRRDREMRDERRSERLTEQSIIQPGEMSSSVTWCNAGNEQRAPTAGREEGDTQTQRAHRHTTSLVYSCSTALSREHWSQSPWLHHTHVRLL